MTFSSVTAIASESTMCREINCAFTVWTGLILAALARIAACTDSNHRSTCTPFSRRPGTA